MRVEQIGNATLYLADCREVLPMLDRADAVIVDPPYSERCHSGHDSTAKDARDGSRRIALGYKALTVDDVQFFAREYDRICDGWVAWMTDSDLALHIRNALEKLGRTTFAPLPFYQPGRSVRLSGDGPSSWTDWIVVARTKAQLKWGTLPGGYVAGPGWNDKARMGGKPTLLMDALVKDYSRPGDTVLDSHMGAGTTGVACVRSGRLFIGCEIEPEAFDIACRRIDDAQRMGDMFIAPTAKQEQQGLAL
jgi:site-specific DNA-methyltransferase (adenine-specific)